MWDNTKFVKTLLKRGEEHNMEEGEMGQTKLGGGRNKGKNREGGKKETFTFREEGEICSKRREGEKLTQKVGRREIYPPVPHPSINTSYQ